MTTPSIKKRVLSGMRPTGKLHLGNYVGALENWVRMQEQYDCFFFIVDWHALTTDYADTSHVKENVVDVLLDWLAAGLDPAKCVMFLQSHVPTHAELHLLLSMITPLGWLERVPTYKEQRENIKEKDLGTYGFLGYPVLQSADILIYKADVVPVGEDQVAHIELTREIARRFNAFYAFAQPVVTETTDLTPQQRELLISNGTEITPDTDYIFPRTVFPEPQSLLTPAPRLPGTDGRKMSKSYGNAIMLTDPEAVVRQKLKTMVTDPSAHPAHRSRRPGCVSRRRSAQNIQQPRNDGERVRRLPVGWNRLHRVQELGCRCPGQDSQPHAGAPEKIRGQSAPRLGYSGSGLGPGA